MFASVSFLLLFFFLSAYSYPFLLENKATAASSEIKDMWAVAARTFLLLAQKGKTEFQAQGERKHSRLKTTK